MIMGYNEMYNINSYTHNRACGVSSTHAVVRPGGSINRLTHLSV